MRVAQLLGIDERPEGFWLYVLAGWADERDAVSGHTAFVLRRPVIEALTRLGVFSGEDIELLPDELDAATPIREGARHQVLVNAYGATGRPADGVSRPTAAPAVSADSASGRCTAPRPRSASMSITSGRCRSAAARTSWTQSWTYGRCARTAMRCCIWAGMPHCRGGRTTLEAANGRRRRRSTCPRRLALAEFHVLRAGAAGAQCRSGNRRRGAAAVCSDAGIPGTAV